MRADANLPDKYWGYATLYAAYIWNVTPKRFLKGQTPKEIFSGKIPDVSRLRTFKSEPEQKPEAKPESKPPSPEPQAHHLSGDLHVFPNHRNDTERQWAREMNRRMSLQRWKCGQNPSKKQWRGPTLISGWRRCSKK